MSGFIGTFIFSAYFKVASKLRYQYKAKVLERASGWDGKRGGFAPIFPAPAATRVMVPRRRNAVFAGASKSIYGSNRRRRTDIGALSESSSERRRDMERVRLRIAPCGACRLHVAGSRPRADRSVYCCTAFHRNLGRWAPSDRALAGAGFHVVATDQRGLI